MPTACRPTEQCLESLTTDWEDVHHQRHWADTDFPVPRSALLHPIVKKAAEDFPAEAVTRERESISGLSDPPWWKVKIGRSRGAAWVDPETGQAWLCDAGLRREGEAEDFYKSFMAAVNSRGAASYLPSDEDLVRLSSEQRSARLAEWEHEVHDIARRGAEAAAAVGHSTEGVPGPSGQELCRLSVEVTTYADSEDGDEVPEGSGIVDVVVQVIWTDWEHTDARDWIELLVKAAIEPREQAWTSYPVGGVPTFSLIMSTEQVGEFVSQLQGETEPGRSQAGSVAHYAHRARLTDSTIDGQAVRSLCGIWFVPRQDHEAMDRCGPCEAVHRLIPE